MKAVVVTGASRGIGRESALALAAPGVAVLVTGRDAARLAEVAAAVEARGARAAAVAADVAEADAPERIVAAALEAFGRIDALVNNAGVLGPLGPLAETDAGAWRENLVVNVAAPAALVRAALPSLTAHRGIVVNVSSGAAVKAVRGWSAYCASKAALNHLTRVIALETPEVTALSFSPGMTDTDMQALIREEGPGRMPEPEAPRFLEAHAAGALRSVAEVGRLVARLALEAPPAWSGEFLAIDDARLRAWLGT